MRLIVGDLETGVFSASATDSFWLMRVKFPIASRNTKRLSCLLRTEPYQSFDHERGQWIRSWYCELCELFTAIVETGSALFFRRLLNFKVGSEIRYFPFSRVSLEVAAWKVMPREMKFCRGWPVEKATDRVTLLTHFWKQIAVIRDLSVVYFQAV